MTDSDVDYGPSASMRSTGDLRIPIEPGASVPDRAGQASPRAADASRPSGDHPSRIVPWPANNQPLDFELISRPVVHAIRFAYDLSRRDRRKNIPWRGPEIALRDQACCPTVTERLKAHNLSYVEEDQGRDTLAEIVSAAIQLGIEQGRRLARSDASDLLDDFSGAVFTVSVGWDDWTHVHTKAGLRSDPAECLGKAIAALKAEAERIARCPREKFLRDSDGSGEAGETGTGSTEGDSAGRDGIAQSTDTPETQP